MSRLIAARISDEQYAKIMNKCGGLGCSTYDYLRMLVESDIDDAEKAREAYEKAREVDQKKRRTEDALERLRLRLEALDQQKK